MIISDRLIAICVSLLSPPKHKAQAKDIDEACVIQKHEQSVSGSSLLVVDVLRLLGIAVVANGEALVAHNVDVGDLCVVAVEDTGDLLESGAAGKLVSLEAEAR